MLFTLIHILGFYLIFIGTWRLATATTSAPVGTEAFNLRDEEQVYNPLTDLFSPLKLLIWICQTVKSFRKPGHYTNAVICHKKFNWGLLWLLFGITVQFVCCLMK